MKTDVQIIIAEDDEGHASLMKKNLLRSGISNRVHHFVDGQAVLDFFYKYENENHIENGIPYLLLLDIRMPKVDGLQVLKKIKSDKNLKQMPVIMITTTDDPKEVERCYQFGCSNYITKPIDYNSFVRTIKQLCKFLSFLEVPLVKL